MSMAESEYIVEKNLITQLKSLGYNYVSIHNYTEFLQNFRKQFCILNKDVLIQGKGEAILSDNEFHKLIMHLNGHTVYESSKILRDEWILDLDNGNSAYVNFLSSNYNENNYQVTHQITMDKDHIQDVLYKNRYDVTLLINGLPLVQIELKKSGIDINEAIDQINRYRQFSFKGLFRYI